MLQKKLLFNLTLRALTIAITGLLFVLFLGTIVFSAEIYPQIDVTGYKRYEYTWLNVDQIQNTFLAQSMLGGYYAGGPWQEKLKLRIIGKLSDKLSVSYDLEQMPDMPEKFDVKVTYDKTELTFGDFQANFAGNEFVSTSKYLNGVMITSKDNWYDLTFVPSSKLKSETQSLVSQRGNNSKGPYNLGHGSIIEGSERIELNNVALTPDVDYKIDYFSGKITFSRILSPDDVFRYSFEFTNIIDLFFPTVSKRDFIGLQSNIIVDPTLIGVPAKKIEKSIKSNTEYFPTNIQLPEEKITKEVINMPLEVKVEPSLEAVQSYRILIRNIPVIILHEISGEAPAENRAELVRTRLETAIELGVTTNEISVASINGQDVVMARGRSIITAINGEAEFSKLSTRDLAMKWRDGIISGFISSTEVITRPIIPETKELEWESTGIYILKNNPIIPYSEKVTFMGTQLKKFEDYLINYQDGTITLLRPNLPTFSEPMLVEYKYTEVAAESETFPGAGKGPYTLANENIVELSESVYVNNIPYVRELDYKIDYSLGKISFFSNIPQTANIVVKYKHLVMTSPPPPVAPAVPRSLRIGVSYLKESGRRGTTAPSIAAMEILSGQKIIDNNFTIYLGSRPVTSTSEVEVKRNDVLLKYDDDYVFPTVEVTTGNIIPPTKLAYMCDPADRSDGLQTGTIYFRGTLNPTDEISISYNYSKWSSDRYTSSGNSGTLTYFLGSFRNLVPGAEIIQIWRKNAMNPIVKTLIRNSSREVYDGHYFINYTDPPNITFNNDPIVVDGETFYLNDISFTVIFKCVPKVSVSERPISHDVLGLDSTFKVGDYLNLDGSFARSKTDQVFLTISSSETFNGNATKFYPLHSPGSIMDGSEQIFLNNQKLNRDDQYAFSYDLPGGISFLTLTPATTDVISVDYDYQDPLGGLVTKLSEKQGNAYKFGLGFKPMSNLEMSADFKKVDANFAPMGGISVPLGSEYRHAYTRSAPLPGLWPSFWLSGDLKESDVPIGNHPDKFLRSSDKNFVTGFNTFGLAQIDFGFRDYSTLDDLLTKTSPHTDDYQLLAYSLSVAPRSFNYGEFAFTNTNDLKKTRSFTDTVDLILPKDTLVDYYHTNNAIDFTRRFRFVVDYQENQPTAISYEGHTRAPYRGKVTEKSIVTDKSYFLNSDLNFWNFRRLSAYINRLEHEENIDKPSRDFKATLNETYHADWTPIDQIITSADHNRQEIPTITTAYGNPKTERSAANVRINPYVNTSLGWSGSRDNSLQESGIRTSGNSNNYSIDHTPISAQNYSLTTRYGLATSLRKAPSGSTEVTTDTRTFSQDYNLTLNPSGAWSITSGYLQEDYSNKNDAPISPIDTKSQGQTIRVGTLYKYSADLDLFGNYSVKTTTIPDMSAHKALVDAHAIYKIFTFGTLNYDWSQEENGGEILGGTFAEQDFTKIIQALSVNIVMPQSEQMILSSIVCKAAVKWAEYHDRLNPINNFQATLLSFEGTLNF